MTEKLVVLMIISPTSDADRPVRPRPRVGGYQSEHPLSAEDIDAALSSGFGLDK